MLKSNVTLHDRNTKMNRAFKNLNNQNQIKIKIDISYTAYKTTHIKVNS